MTMDQKWVVGIDAGGTSTRVLVAEAGTGRAVTEVQGASREDGGPPLGDLLEQALGAESSGSVAAVCAGITKISRQGVGDEWRGELRGRFPRARVEVVPDFVVAFHGATGGVGIMVLAGTGSVVYGEDGRGGAARVGGRGWEYGDEGSGAWLTTEVVRRTLRALDGVEAPTPLTEAVCELLGAREAGALGEEARRRSAVEGRGFLVPTALARARGGDREARNLFVGAAGWLAVQAKATAARLDFAGDAVTLATVGGLWEAGDLLLAPFQQVVRRWLPGALVTPPRASPVQGAALRARLLPDAAGGIDKSGAAS